METNNFIKQILATYKLKVEDIIEMSRHIHNKPISRATVYRSLTPNFDTSLENLVKLDECLGIISNGGCGSVVNNAVNNYKDKLRK